MSRQIGAREISEYAQKYNMKLGKDTPLSMEWCFKMADKAYEKGRLDALDEVRSKIISIHTDKIFDYGVDIIEARADAFGELEEWLKEQK